ncbi:hypothetical protein BH10CYA1_BH10CYA1_53080 [soil metagenome]
MLKIFIVQYITAGITTDLTRMGELARHERWKIRRRVAENPNCPARLLDQLSLDENADVRVAVALNRSVSKEILARLSSDINPDVRFAIASDSCAPLNVLMFLIGDENPYVRNRAARTLDCLVKNEYKVSLGPTFTG